ncbi:hypothetical protein GS399_20380 [Pedobacter sp. HMF7647]|uniref:Small EDRK-rich factor-like N-terminal domain-containing protein n=1 Tax=Hufsiella arboris TaxID=2695275 RepID=A0A7K1YFE5_9SPHI|nr:hypothetical protein [Hufsiella arboris]MXV53324.1 hypothetical protein [Hufsiella arboris]
MREKNGECARQSRKIERKAARKKSKIFLAGMKKDSHLCNPETKGRLKEQNTQAQAQGRKLQNMTD